MKDDLNLYLFQMPMEIARIVKIVTIKVRKVITDFVNVDFSFCWVLIVRLNYVLNLRKQNKFLSKHKLSPVNLTWLSQVYGKMFSFPICWFVLEIICLNNFVIIFFNDFPMMADLIAIFGLLLLPWIVDVRFGRCCANWQWDVIISVSLMADVIAIVCF